MMYLGLLVILLLHHGVQGVQMETFKTLATVVGHRIKEKAMNTLHEGVIWTRKYDTLLRGLADTVVTTALLGCLRLIPNTADIPPLDLDLNLGGPGHLNADNGQVRGLSSVRLRPIFYDIDSNGDILITFPITFTDLHIAYERFQLDNWPIVMTGAADLKFADSEVNVNMRLANPADLLENIVSRKCVFHVGSIQFSGFDVMEQKIRLNGNKDHTFLSEHVFPVVVAEIKKVMLHVVDVRVTNSLYDSLPASGSWVCRDPALNRLTFQTNGMVAFTPNGVANWLPASTEGRNTDPRTEYDTQNFDQDISLDTMNFDDDTDFDKPLIKIYQ